MATLDKAVVRQGDFVLGPVSLQVDAGERIGITGPNGAGKSTLLRLLLGRTEPDEGRASLGANIAIGEIDQAAPSSPVPAGSSTDSSSGCRHGPPPMCGPCWRNSG